MPAVQMLTKNLPNFVQTEKKHTHRDTVERKKPEKNEKKQRIRRLTLIHTSEYNKHTFDMQISLNIENET